VAVMIKALQIVVPAAAAASTLTLTSNQLNQLQVDLDAMQGLVRDTERLSLLQNEAAELDDVVDDGRDTVNSPLTRAEGAALRSLRQLIFDHDRARHFGGLRRFLAVTGDYLWLCPDHYTEYDRGLPQLPPD
jgi:internalin A